MSYIGLDMDTLKVSGIEIVMNILFPVRCVSLAGFNTIAIASFKAYMICCILKNAIQDDFL